MNKPETIQIITLLAGNYDSIANKTKEQKQLMINTWHECLGDLEYNLVLQAVKKTMIESPYPPTIHDIRKNALELMNLTSKKTAIEAWNEALSMIHNGLYMTQEEFEQHSPEVKTFFGNVRQVRELAQCKTEEINTVTKGQFLKQYEIIIERQKKHELLPEKMKNFVQQLAGKMDMKKLEN